MKFRKWLWSLIVLNSNMCVGSSNMSLNVPFVPWSWSNTSAIVPSPIMVTGVFRWEFSTISPIYSLLLNLGISSFTSWQKKMMRPSIMCFFHLGFITQPSKVSVNVWIQTTVFTRCLIKHFSYYSWETVSFWSLVISNHCMTFSSLTKIFPSFCKTCSFAVPPLMGIKGGWNNWVIKDIQLFLFMITVILHCRDCKNRNTNRKCVTQAFNKCCGQTWVNW